MGFRALSTEDVVRVAMTRYLQFSCQGCVDLSWLIRFCGSVPDKFSEEDTKEVELMYFLLVSAEKIGSLQFDCASISLNHCLNFSSKNGTSVQRIVHYFGKALREKFDRETGRITSRGVKLKETMPLLRQEKMVSLRPALIACYQELPVYPATQFAEMQAIIERVASAKRVHFIDLEIRLGSQCTVLMQALAQRELPLEHLTITAVNFGTTSKQHTEEIGKSLAHFAETLNLPFSFKVAMVTDNKDLNQDLFELNDAEVIAVHASIILSHIVGQPHCLESLIRVLRKINPCVMVVTEVEANYNVPSFEQLFFEVLFYYSALFDSLEVCMSENDPNRMMFEETFLGPCLLNIMVNEGEEKINVKHMKIGAWRDIFKKFGLVEAELSMYSLYHAELVKKRFAGGIGDSCTLVRDGKGLIVGWKGSPQLSLSVWRFHQD
ncbi:hypothetical protein Pint_24367 [Pistacia integerrima]|uniref:Uncharacterized protein n=1 Tax=Pistacia integerrima TaxID=434235 RepID=A0ACC0Y9X0_9ROSI|nr:hypothetical protein Pint_24367 [Pistacia integerrima]